MLLKSKKMAYLGVFLAINIILIFMGTVIDTNTLTLFAIASLITGIVVIEFGIKSAITFIFASILLALILIPNKVKLITYIGFFSIYPLIKYWIEDFVGKRSLNLIVEFLLKIIMATCILIIGYLVVKYLIVLALNLEWWVFILWIVGFIIYDYFFTKFINIYIIRFSSKMK